MNARRREKAERGRVGEKEGERERWDRETAEGGTEGRKRGESGGETVRHRQDS